MLLALGHSLMTKKSLAVDVLAWYWLLLHHIVRGPCRQCDTGDRSYRLGPQTAARLTAEQRPLNHRPALRHRRLSVSE